MPTTPDRGRLLSLELQPRNSTGVVHSGDNLPAEAVATAVRLAGAVHDDGPDEVGAILRHLTPQQLRALAVTLAAMVPVEYTPVELLAWNDHRYARPAAAPAPDRQPPLFPAVMVTRELRPHGTHAAFVRHRTNKEEPCEACWHGEREYQRNRKRQVRSAARLTTTDEEATVA